MSAFPLELQDRPGLVTLNPVHGTGDSEDGIEMEGMHGPWDTW